jgi:hypothetical protein
MTTTDTNDMFGDAKLQRISLTQELSGEKVLI